MLGKYILVFLGYPSPTTSDFMIAVGSYLDSKQAGKENIISNMGNQRELSFVVGFWLQSLGTGGLCN